MTKTPSKRTSGTTPRPKKTVSRPRAAQPIGLAGGPERYADWYDFAPAGQVTIDQAGLIDQINLTGARLLGHDRAELLHHSFETFAAAEFKSTLVVFLSQVFGGQLPVACEIKLLKNGVWLQVTASRSSDGRWCYAVLLDITARQQAEAANQQVKHNLQERMKELQAFYRLAEITERPGMTLATLYQELAEILPDSWQYPEITYARIVIGNSEFRTKNFAASAWRQATPIKVKDSIVIGQIEVGYLEEKPLEDEGSFLKEERLLIDAIAEQVGRITERFQAEEALQATQTRLQDLVAANPAILYSSQASGDFGATFISANVSALLGYEPREFIEDTTFWMKHLHPEDAPQVLAGLPRVFEQGIYSHEYRFLRKDGVYRWMRDDLRLTRDAAGQPLQIVGFWTDITERKQIEETLQTSKIDLEKAQQVARVGSWQWDIQRNQLQWSPEMYRIFGLDQATFTGYLPDVITQAIHPDDRAKVEESNLSVIQQQRPIPLEYRVIWPDRSVHTVWAEAGELVLDRTGAPAVLTGIVQDITERKQADSILLARLRITEFSTEHALPDLLQNAVDELCALTNSPIGFFHFVAPDQKTLMLQAWSTRTLNEMCTAEGRGQHYDIDQAGVWVDCVREGRPVIHNDYPSLTHRQGLPEGHAPVKREMVFPITRNQKIVAIIGVGNKAIDYTSDDITYASRLADLIWDIAERKRAEEALRESAEQHRLILQTAMEGFWLVDIQGHLLEVNEAYCRMSGYSAPELLTMRISDLEVRETSNDTAVHIQEIMVQGEDRFESRHRRKDGSTFDVEISAQRRSGQDGQLIAFLHDITERKRVDQAMRESEERFRTIFSRSPICTSLTRLSDGKLLDVNDAFLNLVGYLRAEVVGSDASTLNIWVQPSDRAQLIQQLETQARSDYLETQFRTKAGLHRDVIVITELIDVAGERYILGLTQDVTDRKRTEDRLRLQSSALESAANGVVMTDRAGQIVWVNPAFTDLTGYSAEEALGQNPRILKSNQHDQAFYQNMWDTILAGQVWHGALINRRKDGSWYNEEETITPVRDVGGEITHFIAIKQNITPRVQLETELRQRNQLLAALNRASQVMTSTLDQSLTLKRVIDEVQNLLAAEEASVLLHDPAGNELVFAALSSPQAALLIDTRMPASAGIAGWVFQNRRSALVIDARSDPRWYNVIDAKIKQHTRSIVAAPLIFKGTAIGVLEAVNKASGTFDQNDLTLLEGLASSAVIAIENARLYQAEREQYRNLQHVQAKLLHAERVSAVGRLAASIAHEINNPLQAVQGCLALVKEGLDAEPPANEELLRSDLAIAETEIERIAAIVRRMREFYRPSRGVLLPADVASLLDDVLALSGKQLQHSDISIVREQPDELPIINVDPDQIKQVFLNLVLNAMDAMPEGGMLRVRATSDWAYLRHSPELLSVVRIEFSDTGPGMPPEVVARIPEPFLTTKASGSGLGLSISYDIINAFGGEIIVDSEVGRGTTMTVILPIVDPRQGLA